MHLDVFYRQATYDVAVGREKGRKHYLQEFAAMTEDVDAGIGLLLDQIKALGIEDETDVFFMSDNGGRNTLPEAWAAGPRSFGVLTLLEGNARRRSSYENPCGVGLVGGDCVGEGVRSSRRPESRLS